MSNSKAWLEALRLRTLPLALASTGMGNFLAAGYGIFQWKTCVFTLLTAVLLQILSNLANDYGDYKSGADNANRIGPQRGLQSGAITITKMRNTIIFVALLTLISGCILLYLSIGISIGFLVFFILGLLCIVAAIKYTIGKNPYGYSGLGDVAVFVFFGIIGVGGTFYLHAHYFRPDILLPACTLGFLSAGVLNVNNMRDINNDAASGKNTIVVRMGLSKAKIYHVVLIVLGIGSLKLFTLLNETSLWQWLFLIATPLFLIHLFNVIRSNSEGMDKYLKQLAISTLLLVLCFGISICLHPYV
jgi:1,4-dihydroxy-2-naphthoate octaprenyltransferase